MSILAEPKRKVLYINPNGNTWANDTNTIGKKMMEKMGWSNGKGLGANLDGMTTHVKVAHKLGQLGVGFKDRNDQWTEHEDNFSQLLKNLQSDGHAVIENTEDQSNKSLEMKSKLSKARVHYKKFTRGKDLSRYSTKDLANIFGRRTLENKAAGNENIKVKEEDNQKMAFGVETLHGGNMADYFKKKMGQMKASFAKKVLETKEDVDMPVGESDDVYDARPSFGFGFKSSSEGNWVDNEIGNISKKEKKRKHEGFDLGGSDKSKKARIEGMMNGGFTNPEDNCDSGVSVHDVDAENPYEIKPKKKKSKKAKSNEAGIENPNFNEEPSNISPIVSSVENPYEVVVKEKKKKKRKDVISSGEEGVENPSFNDVSRTTDEAETTQENINPYELVPKDKKRKKKKKQKDLGIENPTFEETTQLQTMEEEETVPNQLDEESTPVKKKKKDKRRKSIEESFTMEEVESTPLESKKKKKKKKNKLQGSETSVTEDDIVSTPDEQIENRNGKRSCSASVNQLDEQDAASPMTPSNDFGICDDLIMNVASFEVKPILQTPQSQNSKLKRRKSVRIDESLNQERIIPNILQQKQMEQENQQHRNELFDINAGVIERSLEEQRKQQADEIGITNEAFNVQSVDDHSFHNRALEVQNPTKNHGIANPVFDNKQEIVERVQKNLDNCQAEVENDLNEERQFLDRVFIGSHPELEDHQVLANGNIKLAFNKSSLSDKINMYDLKSANLAKRGYRHLVKGDIELEMKGTNLHILSGYSTPESLVKNKASNEDQTMPRMPFLEDRYIRSITQKNLANKLGNRRNKMAYRYKPFMKMIQGRNKVLVRK